MAVMPADDFRRMVEGEGKLAPGEKQHDLSRVFRVGERVRVKGGAFRISHIGRRFMRLEGIPEHMMPSEE